MSEFITGSELYHHGVLGMKWRRHKAIRKYYDKVYRKARDEEYVKAAKAKAAFDKADPNNDKDYIRKANRYDRLTTNIFTNAGKKATKETIKKFGDKSYSEYLKQNDRIGYVALGSSLVGLMGSVVLMLKNAPK